MKVFTLTLNPAFDIHCYTESFEPFHENLARITSLDAGGKGVNISRAMKVYGAESTAVVVLGRENADSFRQQLTADGIATREILTDGRIRENITLHTSGAPETRISFEGFSADDSLIERVYALLDGESLDGSIVTLTGRNPSGVCIDAVKTLVARLQSKGARVIIDSRSFSKQDIIDCRPWLIKPNEEEIACYTDINVTDLESAAVAAEELRAKGIENVMISLGAKGAMLCTDDGVYVASAPRIDALSTIGAGDSSIGGLCSALMDGLSYGEMLRRAVAFGSAACMTEGTKPPRRENIDSLLCEVTVKKIK